MLPVLRLLQPVLSSKIQTTKMKPAILQAILEDTYIDKGGVGVSSLHELTLLQDKKGNVLPKG